MKYFLSFFLLLLLSCTSQGDLSQPETTFPVTVNIRIYGDDSLHFAGAYGNNSDTSTVTGIVPVGAEVYASYYSSVTDSSDSVFAKFRKEQLDGQLKVSLYVEDHLKTWQATSNSFDSVYVIWKP